MSSHCSEFQDGGGVVRGATRARLRASLVIQGSQHGDVGFKDV